MPFSPYRLILSIKLTNEEIKYYTSGKVSSIICVECRCVEGGCRVPIPLMNGQGCNPYLQGGALQRPTAEPI
jgi:hypothetical protein